MNSKMLIKEAAAARPDLMEKVAAILFTLEQVNRPVAEELANELGAIADYTTEKLAAEGYGPMARWGAGLGAAVAAGVAGTMATDLYDAAKRGLTKGRNFTAIMKANPEFKHLDKTRLQNTYNTIHRFAPEFTADPIMGGSLLKSVYDAGAGMDHVMVRELIGNRKNLQDVKHTQFRMGQIPALELEKAEDRAREARDQAFKKQMEKDKLDSRSLERQEDAMARARELADKKREDRRAARLQHLRQGKMEAFKADLKYDMSEETGKSGMPPSYSVRRPR